MAIDQIEKVKLDERRNFERFSARYPAKIKDSRDQFGENLLLRDASAEGAKIKSKQRYYINDTISLEVQMPSEPNVTLSGKVLWAKRLESNHWDLGLQFHNLSFMKVSRLYETATGQTIPNHLAFE